MTRSVVRKPRCAIYTRKSSEEGLDQEFNSLEAQRQSCSDYIASQKGEGWQLLPARYDDGGFSGGTMERPALRRLLSDVEAGRVDIVVVYKIDRLSRSMLDFLTLVEGFQQKGVTFVSVTQSFNTTSPMGRFTLNIMASFGQLEREVAGERIRDKVAASRKKGMWMGGWSPTGYRVEDRKLVIDEAEAAIVRRIFERFSKGDSMPAIVRALEADGFRNRYGQRINKTSLYRLLNNQVYIGMAVHRGVAYPGQHTAIITQGLWDKAHAVLAESPRLRANQNRAQTPALLKGLIFASDGRAMSPTHTRKGPRQYRYYVSQATIKGEATDSAITRVPAADVERAVIDQLRKLLICPEIIVTTWREARKGIAHLTQTEVREVLHQFEALWGELFPAEQTRIVRLLVDRVDVVATGLNIRLRDTGLTTLVGELVSPERVAA